MADTAPRAVRVEHVMGTVVSIDIRDRGVPTAAIDAVAAWFHEVDARFSTHREQSEVSRIGTGELHPDDCSADLREVLAICDQVCGESGGAFDARRAHGSVPLDPSAVVKGWSVDRAAAMLWRAGGRNFCVNAGGDIVTRGRPEPGRRWRVGVRHPEQAGRVAVVVNSVDDAIATSGTYERGSHIVDARSGAMNGLGELVSVTVAGPRLALADAYSTAAFVMGPAGVDWVAGRPGYHAYAITADHRTLFTSEFAKRIADRAPAPSVS